MNNAFKKRRCGEIGRRAGLKIQWANTPCRFDSGQRHQRKRIGFAYPFLLRYIRNESRAFRFDSLAGDRNPFVNHALTFPLTGESPASELTRAEL